MSSNAAAAGIEMLLLCQCVSALVHLRAQLDPEARAGRETSSAADTLNVSCFIPEAKVSASPILA